MFGPAAEYIAADSGTKCHCYAAIYVFTSSTCIDPGSIQVHEVNTRRGNTKCFHVLVATVTEGDRLECHQNLETPCFLYVLK